MRGAGEALEPRLKELAAIIGIKEAKKAAIALDGEKMGTQV